VTATPLLTGLAWLLLCQSIGEALTRLAHIGLPGPVIGMLILLGLLRWKVVREPVGAAADALLAHLSLLFVPVGVGVMTHMALISQYGFRLLLVLVLSTWVGLIVTALVLRAMLRRTDAPPDS
jgi:holin-like protein